MIEVEEKMSEKTYQLGLCFYRGANGYPLDFGKAFQCISAAANAGNDEAMHMMGIMYKNGQGVQQSYPLAIDCFYRAIQMNSENGYAAFDLGRMYFLGTGVEKNYQLAYEFLDCAICLALDGSKSKSYFGTACYFVGQILLQQEKYKDAVSYFVEAANRKNLPQAWHNLGYLCEKGAIEVPKNKKIATAMGFYKKAANLGMVQSMEAVGRLYESAAMLKEAEEWMQKAADKGYEPAKKRLKYLKVAKNGNLLDLFCD